MAQLASDSEELHQVRDRVLGTAFQGVLTGRGPSPGVWWAGRGVPSHFAASHLLGGLGGLDPSPTTPAPHPTQVVSSILRNLSWRADINSKKVLREAGSVTALVQCVLRATKVGTWWAAGMVLQSLEGDAGGSGRALGRPCLCIAGVQEETGRPLGLKSRPWSAGKGARAQP